MSEALPGTYNFLRASIGAEVVHESVNDSQIRTIFRIPRGRSTTQWIAIGKRLAQLQRRQATVVWTMDFSRNYFLLPDDDDDYRYRWRLILQGSNLRVLDPEFVRVLSQVRFQSSQLVEVPLHGSPNRSRTAGPIGSVPIGPAAARR